MSAPIAYIDRTRAYYRALGYGAPYRWARNEDVPFAPVRQPLAGMRVAVVTTAAPFQPGKGDQGPGAPYNAAAKFYWVYATPSDPIPNLRISHIAIDRDHTTAADPGTFLPLAALQRAAAAGRVGAAGPRVYGLPTNRSQRTTIEDDAPALRTLCREDAVDAAILVPNCPVCHQSATLAARALETAGVATVILACARDIVARAGAPRALFSDFPLGNAAGRPADPESQDRTLALALDLLGSAAPGDIRHSPLTWPGDPGWKDDYANPARLTRHEIERRRAAFDAGKATARAARTAAGSPFF